MMAYNYMTLREKPELKEKAAQWFHDKWGVPMDAYLECMDAYVKGETEYDWYLCLDGDNIVGGLGVIENDFHDHTSFYECYGWEFLCMVQGDGEPAMSSVCRQEREQGMLIVEEILHEKMYESDIKYIADSKFHTDNDELYP